MKIFKIFFSFLALGLVLKVNAQQDPHFSMYKYNLSVINPAVAGTEDGFNVYGGIREQWTNIEGAPQTQTLNLNTAVSDKVGLGLNVINDNVFIVNETHLYVDFSYKLRLSKLTNLFLGLKAGGSFLNIDLNELGINEDPLLTGNVSRFNPNIGIGAYVKGEKYFVSLSAPGVLQSDRIEKDGIQPAEASNRIHAFLGGGYNFDLNEKWRLKPSTLLKAVEGAPYSLDLTLTAQYMDNFEFGGNYRLNESFTGIAAFRFGNLGKIGFAYEYTTTDVGDYNNGTIEFFLKYLIKKKRD